MKPGRKHPIAAAAPIASGLSAPCMNAKELSAAEPASVTAIAGFAHLATIRSVASRTV
jgi:hypothetical protein